MKNYCAIISLLFLTAGCIENDIPYPYTPVDITDIKVDGQIGETVFDLSKRTAKITLSDSVDIESAKLVRLLYTDGATFYPDSSVCEQFNRFPNFSFASVDELPVSADTRMNFRNPVNFRFLTYQEYIWKVEVNQYFERKIEVDNQVGDAIIDEINKNVVIYVSPTQPLSSVKINKLQLGGLKGVVTPDPSTVIDFRRPQAFVVSRFDKYFENWNVDVVHTEVKATLGTSDAWAKKVTLTGGMKQGAVPIVEYRLDNSSSWTAVDEKNIDILTSTTFKTTVRGLKDGQTYKWRVRVEDYSTNESSFTTEKIVDIPNLNFDNWSQNPTGNFKKSWYPNEDGANSFWATGNDGVTSALAGSRDANSQPELTDVVKGKAAKMTTLGNVTLVGTAAGNLFIGEYKTNMTAPAKSVTFGRSFTGARPTGLKGWYKYKSMPVDYVGTPADLKNDQCHIYVRIWNSDDKEIGYGEFVGSETVSKYTEFSFDINYSDLNSYPSKITIVATSSKYGGDFTGSKVTGSVGTGSELLVDEFELLYE